MKKTAEIGRRGTLALYAGKKETFWSKLFCDREEPVEDREDWRYFNRGRFRRVCALAAIRLDGLIDRIVSRSVMQ